MNGPSEMQPARAEPIRLTYEDLLRFPDDGLRHELIDGEHVVTPSPAIRHQRLSIRLSSALYTFVVSRRLGEILEAPVDVVFSTHDVVEPDILFISADRRGIVREDRVDGAPDLLVEILSPSTRRTDEVRKRHLYDRFGVREYWVVDPEADAVKCHRRSDDGGLVLASELTAAAGDALATPLLPGFSLGLRDLFAE